MGTNNQSDAPALVLGIDTGGTYTDGVLLDYATRAVIGVYKALTTKRDFAIGIEEVITGICIVDPTAIKMVSISTTLATNAIAEGSTGRGRAVALLLLGYDPELVAKFNFNVRFATPHYAFFAGGHDLYGRPQTDLDADAIRAWVQEVRCDVDAIAISGYFSPLNPEHEHAACAAVSAVCDLPVVMGHQLSTKLGSVERATTAALNASLLAILQDFVMAVRRALSRRGIDAPLMVVRGDGTLIRAASAAAAPVETIHSGPAASAIGGQFLAQLDDALVIDVGGTTTDIALVEAGRVVVNEDGAQVNGYKTAVQAANLFSIPLGGDSHIHVGQEGKLAIGPARVVPLAYLAHLHPTVPEQLSSLPMQLNRLRDAGWLEYWFLLRPPPGNIARSPHAQAILAILQDSPQPLPYILQELKLFHPGQIDAQVLWQEELLGRAGLTPTDLLHIEGRYAPWHNGAAAAAAEVFYPFLFSERKALHRAVWQQMTEMIVRAIVYFLTGHQHSPPQGAGADALGQWFLNNSLYGTDPYLATQLRLCPPLIGIGAAAEVVLGPVAEALHTDLVLPPHHEVANAVGAVAGSIIVTEEVLVYPRLSGGGLRVLGYYAQSSDARALFADQAAAVAHARAVGHRLAADGAERAGAALPHVTIEEIPEGIDTIRVCAHGIGTPRLAL